MVSQHLLASCLLQFLVNICLVPVNHCVRVLSVCLTVCEGAVFGSKLFLQNALKCKFHFNFKCLNTEMFLHTWPRSLSCSSVHQESLEPNLCPWSIFFFFFTGSHNHLRVPQSFPIILTNLAPLASPKTPSVLGDLCVVKSSLHTDSTLEPCGLKNMLSPSSLWWSLQHYLNLTLHLWSALRVKMK